MTAPNTTVLITGTKTGIGRALLSAYVLRPHHTVIAAIRDSPPSLPAQELLSIPTGDQSRIIVAQYDAASPTSARDLFTHLQTTHNIKSLDIVIANAGILKHSATILDSDAENYIDHFRINTIGPILLYKATAVLLNQSTQTPRFIVISSILGSNTLTSEFATWPLSAYMISKAAGNFAAGKMHSAEERNVVLPIQPGWVRTEMGDKGKSMGDSEAYMVDVETSVKGVLSVVDVATKEDFSGRFWDYQGKELPW